jgi:hypothetical protein
MGSDVVVFFVYLIFSMMIILLVSSAAEAKPYSIVLYCIPVASILVGA